jgi:hypothetical protein
MAKRLLSVLLAIVVTIILVGFFLPREVLVQRSITIDARQEVAFEVLNDLAYFNAWSPWYARRADARYRLEGPASGPGAALVWTDALGRGDPDGEGGEAGRLRIVGHRPPERVDLQMELGETESEQFLRIEPAEAGIEVAWGMRMRFGTLDLTGRYIGLMLPSLVGGDLQRGLDQLKDYLERHPGALPPRPEGVEASDFPGAAMSEP